MDPQREETHYWRDVAVLIDPRAMPNDSKKP
jgi:hypothetical protein